MKHYFQILGLLDGASREEIQAAYDKLSSELDPSDNNYEEFFVEEYKKVQEAYNALYQSSILKNSESSSTSFSPHKPKSSASSNSPDSFTVTISKEKIEELKNRKLEISQKYSAAPTGLQTLSIISMIGSGLFSFIYFILTFSEDFNNFGRIIFLISTTLFFLKFIGAWRMFHAKKSGFLIYMIPSIIINILLFISLVSGNQIFTGTVLFIFIIMVVFSIIFNGYKEYLK